MPLPAAVPSPTLCPSAMQPPPPLRSLYGIACASCNANACLSLDAAFKSGR